MIPVIYGEEGSIFFLSPAAPALAALMVIIGGSRLSSRGREGPGAAGRYWRFSLVDASHSASGVAAGLQSPVSSVSPTAVTISQDSPAFL